MNWKPAACCLAAALLMAALSCASRGYDRGPLPARPLDRHEEPEITDGGILAALTAEPVAKPPYTVFVYGSDYETGRRWYADWKRRREWALRRGFDAGPDTASPSWWDQENRTRCQSFVNAPGFVSRYCDALENPESDKLPVAYVTPLLDEALPESDVDDAEFYSASNVHVMAAAARKHGANLLLTLSETTHSERKPTALSFLSFTYLAVLPGLVIPTDKLVETVEITATLWDTDNEYLYLAETAKVTLETGPQIITAQSAWYQPQVRRDACRKLGEILRDRFRRMIATGRAR